MSWFTRLSKGNPNHDERGRFSSAPGGGSAMVTPRNATHHTNAAAHAVMNTVKALMRRSVFTENEPAILAAVKTTMMQRASLTSYGMAGALKNALVAIGNPQVTSEMERVGTDGNLRIRSGITAALRTAETASGPSAAAVPQPYMSPGQTPAAPAPAPAASPPASPFAGILPAAPSPALRQALAQHAEAIATALGLPPSRASSLADAMASAYSNSRNGEQFRDVVDGNMAGLISSSDRRNLSEVLPAIYRDVRYNPQYQGGAPASSISGPSAQGSASRAADSPQAAAVQAEAANPQVTTRQITAAGFKGDEYALAGVAENWNTVFKDQSPAAVMGQMFKDKLGSTFEVRASMDTHEGDPAIMFSVHNADVSITRRFVMHSDGSLSVDHSYFELSKANRGHDFGKKFLGNSMALYKKIGVVAVTVHANIDVGGYAWAKYGFVPTADSWADMQREHTRKVKETPVDSVFTAGKKETLLRILKNPDPKAAWDYADCQATTANARLDNKGNKTPVAKSAMINTHWYGKLDLKDPATMERFDGYISKRD